MSTDVLLGKVAIVSGGGGGIGRATALMMASHRARVVVNDINNASAQETAKLINDAGGQAVACSDSKRSWFVRSSIRSSLPAPSPARPTSTTGASQSSSIC